MFSASRLFVLTFVFGTTLSCLSTAIADERPNILFILVDDFGPRDLGCYGSEFYETPNMDLLASQGAMFTQAYVAYPRCVPSRFAIMTGKLPAPFQRDRAGVHVEPPRDTTFGQLFQNAGYKTFYCGKWHLGSGESNPDQVGFSTTIAAGEAGATRSHFAPYDQSHKGGRGEKAAIIGLENADDGEYLADRLTEETMEFIRSAGAEPFVAVLAHYAVHTPIEAKAAITKRYTKKLEGFDLPDTLYEPESAGENLVVQNNATYAAMIESVDKSVGRLMRQLERKGLDEKTVVVLASDHGGLSTRGNTREVATSNRPFRAGKGHLYEGGIRIPLIVRWTGHVEAGRTIATPVITTDLFPTFLELAGLPLQPSAHTDGVSLTRLLLSGEPLKSRDFFWHNPAPRPTSTGDQFSSAVRSGDWKLLEFPTENRVELYNLSTDVGERNNLKKQRPAERDRLLSKLQAWRDSVRASSEPRKCGKSMKANASK